MNNETIVSDESNIVEAYMDILERKDEEASKEFVKEHFGVEGSEEFKTEEYQTFVAAVVDNVIERNRKVAEDEKTAEEVSEAAEAALVKEEIVEASEVVEETVQDEADA